MARTLLAPLFGAAMGLAYAAALLALDRPLTPRALLAVAAVAVAAMLAAVAALVAMRLLSRRPWSARFAAALLIPITGIGGLTSLLLGFHTAWLTHPLPELPLHHVVIIVVIISAGTVYGFLSLATYFILPLGAPLLLLFAVSIARRPR